MLLAIFSEISACKCKRYSIYLLLVKVRDVTVVKLGKENRLQFSGTRKQKQWSLKPMVYCETLIRDSMYKSLICYKCYIEEIESWIRRWILSGNQTINGLNPGVFFKTWLNIMIGGGISWSFHDTSGDHHRSQVNLVSWVNLVIYKRHLVRLRNER